MYDNPTACPALPASEPGHHPTNTTNLHCGSCHHRSGTHCRSPRRWNGPESQRGDIILYTTYLTAPARKCPRRPPCIGRCHPISSPQRHPHHSRGHRQPYTRKTDGGRGTCGPHADEVFKRPHQKRRQVQGASEKHADRIQDARRVHNLPLAPQSAHSRRRLSRPSPQNRHRVGACDAPQRILLPPPPIVLAPTPAHIRWRRRRQGVEAQQHHWSRHVRQRLW